MYERLLAGRASQHAGWLERLGVELRPLPAWPAGEPFECWAWELPGSPSDYGLPAQVRVSVHPDGRVEVEDRDAGDGEPAPVVALWTRRPPAE